MSLNQVNITIPGACEVPDIISSFSPEENYLMLKIGSECLKEGRKVVASLSQTEIYNKIKMETKGQVEKLQMDVFIERETAKKTHEILEEQITKIYKGQFEKLEKQNDLLRQQLKGYELDNKESIQKEVDKIREKYDLLLNEKDLQNKLNRDSVEKLQDCVIKITNKSTSTKGSDGEKQFSNYAETFIDFKGFELIDKHTQSGSGDFHMTFDEFDVLVDAKNYKKKVPVEQRDKIKNDLLKNDHLPFAWLVSLNTSIDKWDKSPIMYEWINTRQCIVYINNLASFEDPSKILRIVWFNCKELFKFTQDDIKDDNELSELKESKFKIMDKVKNIRKTIRATNTSLNTTRNLIQLMDDDLREILESETNDIVVSNISLFDDWWEANIESTNDGSTIISTDLWHRFKQDNNSVIKEMELTNDKFKQFIKSKVSVFSLVLRNKGSKSAFDVKNIKFVNSDSTVTKTKLIDVELEKN